VTILGLQDDLEVVGQARDGEEALSAGAKGYLLKGSVA
jgi:hypothetical protein